MQSILMRVPVAAGSKFSLPTGWQSRGAFDVMGTIEAHIEVSPSMPYADYVVHVVYSAQPVPVGGVHLGVIRESHGAVIMHYYAVPA